MTSERSTLDKWRRGLVPSSPLQELIWPCRVRAQSKLDGEACAPLQARLPPMLAATLTSKNAQARTPLPWACWGHLGSLQQRHHGHARVQKGILVALPKPTVRVEGHR